MKASNYDIECMEMALNEAEIALEAGDFPVGAVLRNEKGDIWRDHADEFAKNRLNGHAERNVIEKFNLDTNTLSLAGLTMYVTMRPCVGCSYAIEQGQPSMLFEAASREDVIEATTGANGKPAVRKRKLDMPGIFSLSEINLGSVMNDSPREIIVVHGLLKQRSIQLFEQYTSTLSAKKEM